jgi:hypothetical protein
LEDNAEEEQVEEESEEELTYADQGESLVIRRLLRSTYAEDDWLRNNIFHTKYTSNGKVCDVIIDGGSCEREAESENRSSFPSLQTLMASKGQ